MKPKLIIFDWDGTLADTTSPITRCFRQTFADCGLSVPDADKVRSLIGYNLPTIVRRLAPDADAATHELLCETYAGHALNPNNRNMQLFDDALPVLETLRRQDYLLAVATGKGRGGLAGAIAQTGTAHYWTATACAGELPSKPAPDMVYSLCEETGLMPSETLVVGDTVYDVEMAANAGAPAVGVSTGAHSRSRLEEAGCLTVLDALSELPDFLAAL